MKRPAALAIVTVEREFWRRVVRDSLCVFIAFLLSGCGPSGMGTIHAPDGLSGKATHQHPRTNPP